MLDFENGNLNWDQLEKNLGNDVKGNEKKSFKDDRFWKLARDENDNGTAIIRLLPDPEGTPFIQRYSHAFQSYDEVSKKKRWYITNSPETIGEACPASELWSKLYNLGSDEARDEARTFGRKLKFLANIKVIKDPANPQNEGKIMLWEFGPKLKDKFTQALNPSQSEREMGEEPKELFNPFKGNNIKLKIKKASGFLNYDDTTIMEQSSIYDDTESAKTDILDNGHKLSEFKTPEAFGTYEELKNKMKFVLDVYKPKVMDQAIFNNVVSEVLGKEPQNTQPGKEQSKQPEKTEEPKTEQKAPGQPKEEPAANTGDSGSTNKDSDLDFLDDL